MHSSYHLLEKPCDFRAKLQKILRVVAEVDGTIKLSGDLQGLIPVYDAFSGANATERRASEQRA